MISFGCGHIQLWMMQQESYFCASAHWVKKKESNLSSLLDTLVRSGTTYEISKLEEQKS